MANVPTMEQFASLSKKIADIERTFRGYIRDAVKYDMDKQLDKFCDNMDEKIQKNTNTIKCLRGQITAVTQDQNRLNDHFKAFTDQLERKEDNTPCFIVNCRGERTGNTWSKEEEVWLESAYHEAIINEFAVEGVKDPYAVIGTVLERLAIVNGRTSHAIRCRLEQLGYIVYEN